MHEIERFAEIPQEVSGEVIGAGRKQKQPGVDETGPLEVRGRTICIRSMSRPSGYDHLVAHEREKSAAHAECHHPGGLASTVGRRAGDHMGCRHRLPPGSLDVGVLHP
jgi:hypothetical protein